MRILTLDELEYVSGGDGGDIGGDGGGDGGGGGGGDGGGDGGDGGDGGGDGGSTPSGGGTEPVSTTVAPIVVTAPTKSDPNYEFQVNSSVSFTCAVGNIPFVGAFGSPSGTLAAGTHLTLTPSAYSKVVSACTFRSNGSKIQA